MKVSGFTFVRNAIKLDYPIVEAISSILPICDEVIVAVGKSEDNTLELIKSIPTEKVKIIETIWDDTLREGGRVLAKETDKAFQNIASDSDWAFYIQADEVLHEKYLDTVRKEMNDNLDNSKVEGLLFKYKHFYGSYDYLGESFRWYRNEIRVIRNIETIFSYRDAQGFRKLPNEKLNVLPIDAEIYHYGWVKHPKDTQAKRISFNKLYHTDEWVEQNINLVDEFDYSNIDSLDLFQGTHPAVMKNRIERINWKFEHDISKKNYSNKERIKRFIERLTGYRIGEYKNYKLIKK